MTNIFKALQDLADITSIPLTKIRELLENKKWKRENNKGKNFVQYLIEQF